MSKPHSPLSQKPRPLRTFIRQPTIMTVQHLISNNDFAVRIQPPSLQSQSIVHFRFRFSPEPLNTCTPSTVHITIANPTSTAHIPSNRIKNDPLAPPSSIPRHSTLIPVPVPTSVCVPVPVSQSRLLLFIVVRDEPKGW